MKQTILYQVSKKGVVLCIVDISPQSQMGNTKTEGKREMYLTTVDIGLWLGNCTVVESEKYINRVFYMFLGRQSVR